MLIVNNKPTAIVIGAGIAGLAMAHALVVNNYKVVIFERTQRAVGASIRNFGMIWPVGQPDGPLYDRAKRSLTIWREVCMKADIWHQSKGSLHLAYEQDENQVLEELSEIYKDRDYRMLSPETIAKTSPSVVSKGLLGGLHSNDEMVVDPKQAIDQLAGFLQEKHGVKIFRNVLITGINHPSVFSNNVEYHADEIYVCSGPDFETLYPSIFAAAAITKCKLQMMRLCQQPVGWQLGPSLCGALSLLHYHSFRVATSLDPLRSRLEKQFPEHIKWGIHVMVSENSRGELTIGDSHEYSPVHDPFDKQHINALILSYLQQFAHFPNSELLESWNGVYSKMTDGSSHFIARPQQGVTIVNGLGGAGMTLSFGLCEEIMAGKL